MQVSLAMKLFGNDVYYEHFHGSKSIVDSLSTFDPRTYVERLNKGEVSHDTVRSWSVTVAIAINYNEMVKK